MMLASEPPQFSQAHLAWFQVAWVLIRNQQSVPISRDSGTHPPDTSVPTQCAQLGSWKKYTEPVFWDRLSTTPGKNVTAGMNDTGDH